MISGANDDGGTALPSGGAPAPGPEGDARPSSRPSFRRVLSNRRFARLWVAQLVSQSGDYIFEVALLWLVLELTHSAFAVGLVVTGTILPTVIVGPILGVYIDRWDRLRTLVATNVVQGLIVAGLSGLVLAGRENLPGLFAIVVMLGTGATTVRVATNAYVPAVVPVDDLPPANGLLSISGSMNQIVGLSLGGVFVALLGVALPIEYDALSFFAAALLLLTVRGPSPAPPAPAPSAARSFRAELVEGGSFIRHHRFMLELILIGFLVNFLGNGVFALFAPFAAYVLHGGPSVYGFLGAFVAAGSLAGALAMGRVDTRRTAGRYVFGGGVGIGVAILALGLVGSLAPAYSLMFGFGITLSVTNIPISVVMQAKIPGRLLGRVTAAFSALIMGTAWAGPLVAGWLAERWSVSGVFFLFGLVIAVIIGLGALVLNDLRRVEY